MKKLRIGVVGLGGIAQKAWLPVLGAATDWTLQGAWSPGREKAERICATWRIPYAASLQDLAREQTLPCILTRHHHQVVSELLNAGVHVCVDKPLAENVQDAERLIDLAARKNSTLMGLTAALRWLYQQLKAQSGNMASLRMDKHRTDSVGPNDLRFTLLDDYLHVVDTALWLSNGNAQLKSGTLVTNESRGDGVRGNTILPLSIFRLPPVCTVARAASVSSFRPSPTVRCMTLPICASGAKRRAMALLRLLHLGGKVRLSSVVSQDVPVTPSPVCKIRRFLKRPAKGHSGAAHCGKTLARCP